MKLNYFKYNKKRILAGLFINSLFFIVPAVVYKLATKTISGGVIIGVMVYFALRPYDLKGGRRY